MRVPVCARQSQKECVRESAVCVWSETETVYERNRVWVCVRARRMCVQADPLHLIGYQVS